MAVAAAVPTESKSATAPTPLWLASLMGGIFVLAAMAALFYGVPKLWDMTLGGAIKNSLGELFNGALIIAAQAAAAVGLCVLGTRLAGDNPITGIRGGIFVSISTIFTVFFFARAVGMILQRWFKLDDSVALVIFGVALGGFGFLGQRFLRGQRFARWSYNLEHAGWFSTFTHKRNQGHRVRRLTIVAVLLILGTGIHALIYNQHLIGMDNWDVVTPFLPTIILLPDAQFTLPLVMIFVALWFAWRLVNHTSFADFLIATEAEMNKVSWTPKKALIRDTIVVLSTLFLITVFLFVVDIFWGWFLSRDLVGVLPKSVQYYYVDIKKLPEEKREAVVQILTAEERFGFQLESANNFVKSVPVEWIEGKSEPARIRAPRRAESKEDGFDDNLADRLVKRLQEAGADAVKVRNKEQQAKLNW